MKSNLSTNFKLVKISYWLLIVLAVLYMVGLPILFTRVSKETRASLKEYLILKAKVNKIVGYLENDERIVLKIFHFVADSITNQNNLEKAAPKRAFEVLNSRSGSCDQQVLLFNQCLNVMHIEAHMVFLFNEDSVSHHTVSEVKLNGKWSMFDPFFNRYFEQSITGKYFSVSELIDKPKEFHPAVIHSDYAKYFVNHFPPVVHQTNKPVGKFKWYLMWIDSYNYFPSLFILNLFI